MSSDPIRPIGEDDLQAFVDGRLSVDRRAAVEDYLDHHPEVAARMASYAAQRQGLRDALRSKMHEPIPARLRIEHLVQSATQSETKRAHWGKGMRMIAASAILLALGCAVGWVGRDLTGPDSSSRLQAVLAVGAHRVFVADSRHPVEIRAEARDQLVQWLSNRLAQPVPIPDLSAAGLRFMGGRLIATPSGPAAQLMYDDDAGTRVTLFIEPERRTPSRPTFADINGIAAMSWCDDRFAYTVAAQSDRDRIASIGSLVRQQLPPGSRML